MGKAEAPTGDMGSRPANGGTQRAAVPDAVKSEKPAEGAPLAKGEDRIKELEAQIADQNEQITGLVKAVKLVMEKPLRKAVTGMPFSPKGPEAGKPMTKAEANAKLNELSRSGKLSKAEGERVIAFTLGHINIEQIQDLLQKK
jgi:hypothetical protein